MEISDDVFADLIGEVMDELPQEYIVRLKNVAVTYDDEPSAQQRKKLKLRGDQTLFGLYEGVPLTRRNAGYNLVLPDKITLFKGPLSRAAGNSANFRSIVKHTLWHEIAHYYGLDHDRIHEIERHWR